MCTGLLSGIGLKCSKGELFLFVVPDRKLHASFTKVAHTVKIQYRSGCDIFCHLMVVRILSICFAESGPVCCSNNCRIESALIFTSIFILCSSSIRARSSTSSMRTFVAESIRCCISSLVMGFGTSLLHAERNMSVNKEAGTILYIGRRKGTLRPYECTYYNICATKINISYL